MPRVSREEFQRRLDTQHQLQITLLNYDGATKPATFKYECCGTEKSLSSAKGILDLNLVQDVPQEPISIPLNTCRKLS